MQSISLDIIKDVRKSKMQKLHSELQGVTIGEMIQCPSCMYIGKNKRGTAKIFAFGNGKAMKCFSCGIWRKL